MFRTVMLGLVTVCAIELLLVLTCALAVKRADQSGDVQKGKRADTWLINSAFVFGCTLGIALVFATCAAAWGLL